jgi:hypothetical protein
MASYAFKGRGAALPYDSFGHAVLRRNINLPALVATDFGKLALAATPTVGLTSFTGFVQNDVLEVFEVPAGFAVTHVGYRCTTAEGATAAITIGNASATQTHLLTANADGLMGTGDLVAATTVIGLIADEDLGGSTYNQLVFVTAGSIDITFTTNDTYAAAIFDVFVSGYKAF